MGDGGPRRGAAGIVKIEKTAGGERSFLPVPAEIPVCGHNPATPWSEALTGRLTIQSAPPHRLILLDGEVVFRYRLDNLVEERFFLLRLIANEWITARALARRWGVSRNTIGDWSWRYRFFGLDGLVDGRLPPQREVLQQLLGTAQTILRASPGLSLTALGRALEQAGHPDLPPPTLRALRAALAEEPPLPLAPPPGGPAAGDGDDDAPCPEPPSDTAPTAALPAERPGTDQAPAATAQDEREAADPDAPSATPPEPAPEAPTPRPEPPSDAATTAALLAERPSADQAPAATAQAEREAAAGPEVPPAAGPEPAPQTPTPRAERPSDAATTAALPAERPSADQAPAATAQAEREAAAGPEVPLAAGPEPAPQTPTPRAERPDPALDAAAVEVLPAAVVVQRTPLRYAGLALVLPILQEFFTPELGRSWEQLWGQRAWLYRPVELVTAFVLQILCGFFNPEQVKAAPGEALGPLLGHRRGPATVTLRRRLPAMAREAAQVEAVGDELALQYLRLGWVQLDWWAIDNHFVPYFGRHNWGKAWWTQRRYAHPGHCQTAVHDAQGRPLLLRFSQAFELFGDELPAVAHRVQDLLRRLGEGHPMIAVFDRGGALAPVFRALDALRIPWLSYRRGSVHLPPEAFGHQIEHNGRTRWYAEHRFRVDGYHDAVAGVVWHDGDVQHQTALLCNFDRYLPARYVPAELIAIPRARWAQETAFKSQERYTDLGWSNGYVHEPCAETAVPNPQWREGEHKLAKARQRLERHLRRPEPSTSQSQARRRRRTGVLRAAVTRRSRRLAQLAATVPYGSLGRKATEQPQAGRGTLIPTFRILAYHVRAQFRDRTAQCPCDLREVDKAIRLIFTQPGCYLHGDEADVVQIEAPSLPRFAKIAAALVEAANAAGAHAPRHPDRPLRFELVNRPAF